MEIKIDRNLYADSLKAALKVDFLKSSKELKLYAASIYNASMWAREIDKKLAIRTRINPSPIQQQVLSNVAPSQNVLKNIPLKNPKYQAEITVECEICLIQQYVNLTFLHTTIQ